VTVDIAGTRHPSQHSVLFYEEASYAPRRAFVRVTSDEDGSNDAFARCTPAGARQTCPRTDSVRRNR
jgi:hypothetical protein